MKMSIFKIAGFLLIGLGILELSNIVRFSIINTTELNWLASFQSNIGNISVVVIAFISGVLLLMKSKHAIILGVISSSIAFVKVTLLNAYMFSMGAFENPSLRIINWVNIGLAVLFFTITIMLLKLRQQSESSTT